MTSSKTGITHAIARAFPLIIIDVIAVYAAYIVAGWGTQVFDDILGVPNLLLYIGCQAVIVLAVFAIGHMYNALWEYASTEEAVRIVIVTLIASVLADVVVALLFAHRMPYRVYICAAFILMVVVGASRFAIRVYSSRKGLNLLGVSEKSGLPAASSLALVRQALLRLSVC